MFNLFNRRAGVLVCLLVVFFSMSSNIEAQVLSNRPRDDDLFRKLVSVCIKDMTLLDLDLTKSQDANTLKLAKSAFDVFEARTGSFNLYELSTGIISMRIPSKPTPAINIAACVTTASAIAEGLGQNGEVELKQLKDLQEQVKVLTEQVKKLRERVEADIFKVLNK